MSKTAVTADQVTRGIAHWMPVRLRYLGRLKGGAGFPDGEQGIQGEDLPFFKVKHLAEADADGCLRFSEHTVSRDTATQLGAFVFPAGTIVFAKVGAALLLNRFRFLGQASCIDNNMMGLVLDGSRADKRFMLHSLAIVDFGRIANPGAVPSLNAEQAAEQGVLLPPLPTQLAIADYLDRETARLDALVAGKERVLGLLAEKRRALITRAVTRGLDHRAPLRDSGIPWLHEIPMHWKTSKFTWSVFIVEGQVDPEIEPYVSMVLVAPNHIESGTGRLLNRETAAEQAAISGKYLCQQGDVIYSKIRPALRKATIAADECLCSADMYPLRVRDGVDAEYLLLFLLSEPFSTWAVLESNRVAMPKINREALSDIRIPVPPLEEQRLIVGHISKESVKLDAMRSATERTIALIKERRAALIVAAVTGTIDVREEIA